MPIYEFGYRPWQGKLRHRLLRWWPITRVGVALALRSRLLRRVLFLAWMPLLYFGPLFFFVGSVTDEPHAQPVLGEEMVREFLGDALAARLRSDPQGVRSVAWSVAFYYFLGYTQGIAMMLVLAMVGPPLIAHDVRGKAFLLYFSKPITRSDYLLGKAGILLVYLAFVSLLPSLTLYVISIGFAPSLAAFSQTSSTIIRLLAAWLAVSIPMTLLMLCLSSLTSQPRHATFLWIALWVVGQIFYGIMAASPGLQDASWTFALSLHHLALTAVGTVFDVAGQLDQLGMAGAAVGYRPTHSPTIAWTVLASLCVISLLVLLRRVSAPMRI